MTACRMVANDFQSAGLFGIETEISDNRRYVGTSQEHVGFNILVVLTLQFDFIKVFGVLQQFSDYLCIHCLEYRAVRRFVEVKRWSLRVCKGRSERVV